MASDVEKLVAKWRSMRREYDGSAGDALCNCADELEAALTQPAASGEVVAHTLINHEQEPHCIGCYDVKWNDGDPIAECNECGHNVKLLGQFGDWHPKGRLVEIKLAEYVPQNTDVDAVAEIVMCEGIGGHTVLKWRDGLVPFLMAHRLGTKLYTSPQPDADTVRDAQAWRHWCEAVGAQQVADLSEKFGDALGLVRDAERYRWLRDNAGEQIEMFQWLTIDTGHSVESVQGFLIGEQIDAAIDSAIKGEKS